MSQEEIDSIDVGRRLRVARETAGMTQSAAAGHYQRSAYHPSGDRERATCRPHR